jgi:hypothetical protein
MLALTKGLIVLPLVSPTTLAMILPLRSTAAIIGVFVLFDLP